MNYSENEGSVRASLFKTSGKWYSDYAIDMSAVYYTANIHDALKSAVRKDHPHLMNDSYKGWRLVVLEPYHMHSHPLMITL